MASTAQEIADRIADAAEERDWAEVIKLAEKRRDEEAAEKVKAALADAKIVKVVVVGYNGQEVTHQIEAQPGKKFEAHPGFDVQLEEPELNPYDWYYRPSIPLFAKRAITLEAVEVPR